jgi:enoyl-CoA hydratase/carnithine racemase
MSQLILSERKGSVLEITINRPEKRNAISVAMWKQMAETLTQVPRQDGIRCLLIRGAGNTFCAGIDVNAFLELKEIYGPNWHTKGRMITRDTQGVLQILERLEIPSIAVIEGHCLGMGLELALACDFRIAAEKTKIGLPETLLGLVPDVGGTARLTRLIGVGRAKELILTGKTIDAQLAHEWGIVNRVCPATELQVSTNSMVQDLCEAAPLAVGMAKRIIDSLHNIDGTLDLEGWAQTQLYTSEDFNNAVASFAAKKKPIFVGR